MDKAMMSTYRPGCDRGFTLVEIMIAVFILVIALLGLISTTVIVIKSNSLSKTMTAATTLARDKMEPLKKTGYNDLTGGTDYCDKDSACQSTSTANSVYTRTWTVSADGVPAAGLKTIAMTVQWNWQGSPHSVSMSTIVAR